MLILLGLLGACPALRGSLVTDRRMETAVRSSYVYRVILQDRVHATAEFGVLTLTGNVEDKSERMLAEDTARSIPWVIDVNNQVTLMPSFGVGSDEWLELRVAADLRLKAGVQAETTRVAAAGGRITLNGTALDELQRERTSLIAAAVPGVKALRNQLLVVPAPAGEESMVELIDDASITALVMGALREHGLEVVARVRVSVAEGAVRITGRAENEAQKIQVTQLAREAHGSRFVINLMKLAP